ncbi:MAG: hypothetical protein HYX35_07095 [Proteobacteria bacterium]|nr:hypothetical protein [Pseudomonadota bacterium]
MTYGNKASIAAALIGAFIGFAPYAYAMEGDVQDNGRAQISRVLARTATQETEQKDDTVSVPPLCVVKVTHDKLLDYRPSQTAMTYQEFLADFYTQAKKEYPELFVASEGFEVTHSLVTSGQRLTKDNFEKFVPDCDKHHPAFTLLTKTKPKN